jgi:hypothetical protein
MWTSSVSLDVTVSLDDVHGLYGPLPQQKQQW